jgi:carboxypeptidase family protein
LTPLASQLSVTVRFVDDGRREGSATGTTAISKPISPSVPASTTYSVNGLVTDGTSGGVLPNIVLRVADGPDAGKSATTDAGGRYAIGGIAPGTFTLSASAVSYLTRLTPVTVSSDTRVDIVLSRCRYTLSSHNQSVPFDGGSYEVQVASDSECPWTATPGAIWIAITRGSSGIGNGSFAYAAAANSGAARSGTVNVAGETLAVAQAAAPPPPPPPPPPTPAPPPPAPAPTVINLAGSWSGTGGDSKSGLALTWTLAQTGTSISGTVGTQAIDVAPGSCSSCHRSKTGTVTGTIAGTTLTMTMTFPAGVSGDPTPICSATLTGAAASITSSGFNATYSGADTCEGTFLNGTLAMTRHP